MKRFCTILAWIGLFAMLLSVSVFANHSQSSRVYTVTNPLLKHGEETSFDDSSLRDSTCYTLRYYSDPDAVAEMLREAMVRREETVTIGYRLDHLITDEELDDIFARAVKVTDRSYEGDYLLLNWQSYRVLLECESNGTFYDHLLVYQLHYETTAAQEAELADAIDGVLNGFGFDDAATDYEKIRTIYDYICSNVTYDYANLSDPAYTLKHTAYAAMLHKTAVCEGYAELLYRMALECGLQARIIVGSSNGESHAWNMVKLGDVYYNLDATWDAGQSSYGFFLRGSQDFPEHTRGAEYDTPRFHTMHSMAKTVYVLPEIPAVSPTPEVPKEPVPEVTPTPAPVKVFSDVHPGEYFYEPVYWAARNGITNGIDETHFGPYQSCTRAQVVTFLYAANGRPPVENAHNPFADVQEGDWYYDAVLWAVENGITSGLTFNSFGPNESCTRAQIATFLYRAAGSPQVTSDHCVFADVSSGDWFETPVIWALENGITKGIGNNLFGSHNICTRGQIVTFLYNTKLS